MFNSSMPGSAVMVGLGELLWDVLPSGTLLGGAPANFAYMATSLGDSGIVASRVGEDSLGERACHTMAEMGLNTLYLQTDAVHETGTASVVIDSAGQPTFSIREAVAWDFLEWTEQWAELSRQVDVVCYGTLAQRSPTSAGTIDRFLRNMRSGALRVCDVNLRQSFYNAELLHGSLGRAHIVKLNSDELCEVSFLLGLGAGDEALLAKKLMSLFNLRIVCITRGANGSLLMSEDETIEHRGFRVKVSDAVGSGDAFTACLAHCYLRGKSLKQISESANRIASWVASQVGATPVIPRGTLEEIFGAVVPE
jgi:fructokinase